MSAVVLLVGVGAVGLWLWDVYASPNRADLSAYWQLVVAVVAVVVAVITLAKDSPAHATDGASEFDRFADLFAEAVETQWTEAAMGRRLLHPDPIAVRWSASARSMAGSPVAATRSTRFAPLPGLAATRPEKLRQGGLRDLHSVYGGLGSGRLVIAGAPGAGKSGAAVLLVLDALAYRRTKARAERPKVPVPVLFTLHGWNPNTQPVVDWLISQLRQNHEGFFTGRRGAKIATKLLNEGMLAVVLDGLDEIAEEFRPVVLRALNDQAIFRVVVLARSTEMIEAAEHAILDGAVAVELQEVEPATAADYLVAVQSDPLPPRGAELVEFLRKSPESPLARALNSPLTLTLVRDTYRGDDSIGELLDFVIARRDISREDIEEHLLDRVLSQAYTPKPGRPSPRYTLSTAQRTLGVIACLMDRDHTRDLAWWRIPNWVPAFPRAMAVGLATGVATWLGFGLLDRYFWLSYFHNLAGLLSGLGGLLGVWLARKNSPHTAPRRWEFLFAHPSALWFLGFTFGYMLLYDLAIFLFRLTVLLVKLMVVLVVVGLAAWLLTGLVILLLRIVDRDVGPHWLAIYRYPFLVFTVGLGCGFIGAFTVFTFVADLWAFGSYVPLGLLALVLGLRFGFGSSRPESTDPLTPFASWVRYRMISLGIWFVFGGLAEGFLIRGGIRVLTQFEHMHPAPWPYIAIILLFGLVFGIVLGAIYPETWTTSLACAQLAIRRRLPVQLIRFLDDARGRDILRTVGPVYQFRHARLQDHLAKQVTKDTRPTLNKDKASLTLVASNSQKLSGTGH